MIEYCQVQYDVDKHRVVAVGEVIVDDESFLGVFNKLGALNWKMCGQSLRGSYAIDDERKGISYSSVFYFMREVKDV